MALVQCEECGNNVSPKARQCVHCGCPRGPGANSEAAPLVRVVAFDMDFGEMILMLVKLAIAAVPATIIVVILWTFIAGVFTGVMRSI